MPAASGSEVIVIVEVVAPVLQTMPELHELCEEPTSPLFMVFSMVVSAEALTVERTTLDTFILHTPIPEALFTKKLSDLIARLKVDSPSRKMVGCHLKDKADRGESKKEGTSTGSGFMKEKSFKSTSKNSNAMGKVSAAA